MSIFDVLWQQVAREMSTIKLSVGSCREIMVAMSLMPMAFSSWRCRLSDITTCSDASETGGGFCGSVGLTTAGEKTALRLLGASLRDGYGEQMEAKEPSGFEPFMTIEWFAGMGGLGQALRLAELEPVVQVVCENNPSALRVLRHHFPNAVVWTDLLAVEQKHLWKVFDLAEARGARGLLQAGGSPCQGLSRLSSQRRHFGDARSALFFKYAALAKQCEEMAKLKGWWFLSLTENVVSDVQDQSAMNEELETWPCLLCPQGLTPLRRPRLFWCRDSQGLGWASVPEGSLRVYETMVEQSVTVERPLKIEEWITPGWRWEGGVTDPSLTFPTATRAIPRKVPPPRPAGIERCTAATLRRWREHGMRYPPYTYQEQYLLSCEGLTRVLNSQEREVLSFFPAGWTSAVKSKTVRTLQAILKMSAVAWWAMALMQRPWPFWLACGWHS